MGTAAVRFSPRRIAFLVALIALGAVGLSSATDAAATRHRSAPKLTLVRTDPLTISGSGFVPRRKVLVKLTTGRGYSVDLLASRSGSFTATFPTAVDRCSAWSVTARQGAAMVRLHPPVPLCLPASTP